MKFSKLSACTLCLPLVLGACSTPSESPKTEMRLSFVDLMKLGKDYMCTFTDEDDLGNESEGTVYIEGNGKNFRGEFTVTQKNGESYDAYVIRKDMTSYVWTSTEEQGMMMRMDPEDNSLFGTDQDDEGMGMNENEPVDFKCRNWNPESSMFKVPSDREFMDVDAMMEGMQQMMDANMGVQAGGSADIQAMQCAACEKLPTSDSIEQCKAAVGC